MFNINDIIRPLDNAYTEYSVCGNPVLIKAKVVEVFSRRNKEGNNIRIEILEHANPHLVGQRYRVDDRYFERVEDDGYIWIDAYKGTNSDMTCKGKQYHMNVEHTFDGKTALGAKGYHVCTDLKHCFKNYDYDFRNRFFKVKALVKATDYEYRNPLNTTLVAKAIKFVEEITNAPETIAAKRNSL